MTSNEFMEIHEAWMELRTIYDEIDAMNREETSRTGIAAFGSYATPAASAR